MIQLTYNQLDSQPSLLTTKLMNHPIGFQSSLLTTKLIDHQVNIHFLRHYSSHRQTHALSQKEQAWNEWFAGLIDGDGCFLISKAGQISLEITTGLEDAPLLQQVKNRVGGVVKPRSGSKSVRLRVFRKQQLLAVLGRVNGLIRLPARRAQLQKVCQLLQLTYQPPCDLTWNHGYLAGLFDADGSVTLSVSQTSQPLSIASGTYGKYLRLKHSKGNHQLSLHIVSKDATIVQQLCQVYGFGRYLVESVNQTQKRPNPLYRWYFGNVDQVACWLAYVNQHALRSHKRHRCFLLQEYFYLKQNKAHLACTQSVLHQQWDRFCRRWFCLDD